MAKNVSLTGIQFGELLSTYEASLGSQVEGQIHRLEQEVVQLRWKSDELSRMAGIQDHICFLKVMSMKQCAWKSIPFESHSMNEG